MRYIKEVKPLLYPFVLRQEEGGKRFGSGGRWARRRNLRIWNNVKEVGWLVGASLAANYKRRKKCENRGKDLMEEAEELWKSRLYENAPFKRFSSSFRHRFLFLSCCLSFCFCVLFLRLCRPVFCLSLSLSYNLSVILSLSYCLSNAAARFS